MKITFIRPNLWEERSADAMQPLVFAMLAAITPPEHQITFFDERVESIDFDHESDVVAITVESYTARRAYEISHRFRQRGIPVIMGGFHPTLLPNEARHFADAVVVGDAENLWHGILDDVENDELKSEYSDEHEPDLSGIIPDRRIFKEKNYTQLLPVSFGRGCRFACDFCSIYSFYNAKLIQRPIGDLLSEIDDLRSKYIFFIDDNLFINDSVTKQFLNSIKPLKIKWIAQVSIDIAKDPELLDLMAECGCITTLIGFESLNVENLVQMKKKWNLKYGDYQTAIRQINERGMMIYASFMLGFDSDTKDAFKRTVDFALENKFCIANFNPITPMPGTNLYARLKKEDRLVYDRWWLDPQFRYGDATIYPKNMTPDELTEGCYWARTEFNKYSSVFKRSLDKNANAGSLSNLAIFLISNLISRKEIHKKQGRPLGTDHDLVFSGELL